jgi:hypothetical protein
MNTFSKLKIKSKSDNIVHMVNDPKNATYIERWTRSANNNRKITLIPNSAGTTAADLAAKSTFWFRAIKINAITIVDGRVPKIPPIFVP